MPSNTLTKSASKSATRKNKGLTAEQKAEIRKMLQEFNEKHLGKAFSPFIAPSRKAANGAKHLGGGKTRRKAKKLGKTRRR